jgi:CHAT domain
MSSVPPGALALAEEAYALVQVDPRRAASSAERALVAAAAEQDAGAEAAALHALAWAQLQLGDSRARATVEAGIRVAERNGDARRSGLLRRRLALSHAMAGDADAAQREIEAAVALLRGSERARSEVFRLAIHRRAQAADPELRRAVLARAARALRSMQRDGDELWEARLRRNRGLLLTDRGELDAADADLRRAYELYRRLGAEAAALDAVGSLAEVARLRGDVVGCLQLLEEAIATQPTARLSFSLLDYRAAALAEARLLPEARAAVEAYAELCARAGSADEVPRALLGLSSIALAANDAATAREVATQAARRYRAQRQPVGAALARVAVLRARVLAGDVSRTAIRSASDAGALLARAGRRREALRAHLVAARVALAAGSAGAAARQLELALPLRRTGTAVDRIELCHAQALLRVERGERAQAQRLVRRGLTLLEEYRAALGAVELRAAASTIGRELAELGLTIAFASGRPRQVLTWAERLRANALRLQPVRPLVDPELRSLQSQLRQTAARIRTADGGGRPSPGDARRQAQLEEAIRARTRAHDADGAAIAAVRLRDASSVLGGRVLVEYVEHDGFLFAVTLADRRVALHELGPNCAGDQLEWLRFGLARAARAPSAAERTTARAGAAAAAAALDAQLVAPLLPVLGGGELVVVPTGALHVLPWGALPALAGRTVTVAPSLSTWLELARRPRSRRRKPVLIAGPRLRHSTAEVNALAPLYDGAAVLSGRSATAAAALAALDGASLAHLACHGRFRADSPLFSSLELADGPLNVYELQRLRRPPELVVLSACDLAISGVHPGDELLGLAAALLGLGTRTIVASVVPVPDLSTKRLMLAFHRELLAGSRPAAALARVQRDPAAATFVCLGDG